MQINIPLYRAKRLSNNKYITGQFLWDNFEDKYWIRTFHDATHRIDPTTLSIHFSKMIDVEGTKIFASLREDGKGGDIVKHVSWGDQEPMIVRFNQSSLQYIYKSTEDTIHQGIAWVEYLKVIGIQE